MTSKTGLLHQLTLLLTNLSPVTVVLLPDRQESLRVRVAIVGNHVSKSVPNDFSKGEGIEGRDSHLGTLKPGAYNILSCSVR